MSSKILLLLLVSICLLLGYFVGFVVYSDQTIEEKEVYICYSENCSTEELIAFIKSGYLIYDNFDGCCIYVLSDKTLGEKKEKMSDEKVTWTKEDEEEYYNDIKPYRAKHGIPMER